ncbi:MAG: amidohydrolase, imidazolonepropionase [Gemmatimonadetes bacterium]|nr:amidohydrolase, imidazolonepropionase [Gemmatimonadota bacterium]
MRRYPTAFGLLLLILPSVLWAQRPTLSENVRKYVSSDTSLVAITGVTVIDGRGGPAVRDQTVVIRDGRIADVGPSSKVRAPGGALVVDGTGATLIPGIIGMHDHMFYTAAGGVGVTMSYTGPKLYLASGVTSVRTTGTRSPYADINLKHAVDSGFAPGPRIHVTTPYLTGPEGGGSMSVASEPEQARRFVAYWAAEGATWVKFYTDISRAAMKAAIDEAHKQGIKATGHLCSVTFKEAVDLGIDDFAHGVLTASDFIAGKQPDKCPSNVYKQLDSLVNDDSQLAKSLIDLMISRKVSMTTTMAIYEALYPGRPVQDERSLELMTPVVRAAYVKNRAYIDSVPGWMFTPDGFRRALAFDKAFYAAGGVLASGVDPTGNGGALPGFGDQRGYELLREGGLSAEQAVQVVSYNGARVLGVERTLGSVEKGKIADLVLLKGDLVADPSVIRNVVTVYKDGVAYDPARLIDAVKGRVGVD